MFFEVVQPLPASVVSFLLMWASARFGYSVLRKRRHLEEGLFEDYGVVLSATLTLLGLIIAFSFSMAIGRYDQRKNYEEAEANAIGTEFVRADLLPPADAAQVRALMRKYLDQRILFYSSRDVRQLPQINAQTAKLQNELWSSVRTAAAAQPTPIVALAVAGMNDVLNSQGYTQAAWWNRIPRAAWGLMAAIAISCNLLVGYGSRTAKAHAISVWVLPLVLAIAFLLIADIDSPRGGLIRVNPQNLQALVESLPAG